MTHVPRSVSTHWWGAAGLAGTLACGCATNAANVPSSALVLPAAEDRDREPQRTSPTDPEPGPDAPPTEATDLRITIEDTETEVELGPTERVMGTPERPRFPSMLPGVITGPSGPH